MDVTVVQKMNQERKRWTWPLLSQQYGTLAETQLTPTNRAGLSTSPYFFTGHGYHMEDDVELLSYSVVDDDDIELLGYDVIEVTPISGLYRIVIYSVDEPPHS